MLLIYVFHSVFLANESLQIIHVDTTTFSSNSNDAIYIKILILTDKMECYDFEKFSVVRSSRYAILSNLHPYSFNKYY